MEKDWNGFFKTRYNGLGKREIRHNLLTVESKASFDDDPIIDNPRRAVKQKIYRYYTGNSKCYPMNW